MRSVTDCLVCSKRGEIRDIINAGDLKLWKIVLSLDIPPFPFYLVYKQSDDPAGDRPPPCDFYHQCLPPPGKAFYVDVHESFVTETAFTSIFLVLLQHPTPFVGSIKNIYFGSYPHAKQRKKKCKSFLTAGFIRRSLSARCWPVKSPRLYRTCNIGHLPSIRSPLSLF